MELDDDDSVTGVDWHHQSLVATVETSGPGLIVVRTQYFPGWHAQIDGLRAKVMRADDLFQAIPVERGKHELKLTYKPESVMWGSTLSVVGSVVLIISALLVWTYQRRDQRI
ncbi:MAG: YfhO family protein [Gammaproteobacteria bacterium]|nr:YfhO family protein [Gammaproteobacteria bacterium]MDH3467086.1 YfhO family protein [Gammaproteobacteria bacterium]